MLVFCGCVGQAVAVGRTTSAGKTASADRLAAVAFALDWRRPARRMNSTSYFYNHSSQWRYETS
ncbi:hypothetical protein KCP78_07785 [Salmonella enterica subsp. enterica]|nr:hypothetical protein KCP78_07785 [Salmonella enterica subsp. enterica]